MTSSHIGSSSLIRILIKSIFIPIHLVGFPKSSLQMAVKQDCPSRVAFPLDNESRISSQKMLGGCIELTEGR